MEGVRPSDIEGSLSSSHVLGSFSSSLELESVPFLSSSFIIVKETALNSHSVIVLSIRPILPSFETDGKFSILHFLVSRQRNPS